MHGFGFGYTGWGMMLGGLVLFLLVLIGLIILVVWAVRQGRRSDQAGSDQPMPSAEEILKARYARGEITREQYLSMLEDLKA